MTSIERMRKSIKEIPLKTAKVVCGTSEMNEV